MNEPRALPEHNLAVRLESLLVLLRDDTPAWAPMVRDMAMWVVKDARAALAAPQEPASPAAPVDCPPYSAGPLLERGWDMAACDAAAEVLQRRDQPYYAQLDAIGSVIGYGRAKQILQELWDAMLERKYPK